MIALLISGLIAAALLFAEARWVPLRRRLHRPLRRLRGAARRPSKTSAAPALAFAGAAQPPDAARPAERQSPGVRHAAHLTPSRPKKAATGTVPSDKNPVDSAGAEDPAMVADRAASYSLAPPKSAPAPAAEDEPAAEELDRSGAPTGTTTLDTLCARIESEITRARDKHLALSIIAMHLYPTSDAAPDLSGVDEAVGRTARKLLGHGAEVVVVESEDDTVWLILPGVLTKRSQAVAEQLRKVIVPYEHRPAVAAVGFPTDGKTAAELVRRCLDRTTRASISREEVAPA